MQLIHRGPRALTVVLPALATLVVLAVAWPTAHVELRLGAAAAMVVGLAAALPLALAGAAPLVAWALSALGAAIVGTALGPAVPGLPLPAIHVVALLGLLLVVTVVCVRWAAVAAAVGTALVLLLGLAPVGQHVQLASGMAMVLVLGLMGRQVLRARREAARQEEIGTRERERRVVLEERARIARDLHDVVAHSMSMVVVRAESARYRVPDVSEAAAAELTALADTARDALGEVRAMLGVLRDTAGEDAEHRPQPGLTDVDELLDTTARAGVDVTVERSGDASATTPAVAVSLYRILQEALTNASRHAGGAPVAVGVEHGEDAVHVRVHNGPGTEVTGPGAGFGVTGMRDRAAAVGGTLHAGPLDDGGFQVDAHLPLTRHLEGAGA